MQRLLILAITVVYSITTSAQLNNADLNKARDYINSKVTYLMLTEYVKTDTSVQYTWESLRPVLETNSIDNVLPYQTLSNELNKGFPKTKSNLSDPINKINIEKYSTETTENASIGLVADAFQVLNTSYPNFYLKVENNKAILTEDVKKLLHNKIEQNIIQDESFLQNNDLKSNEEEPGFFSLRYFNFWTLLSLLLPLAALGFVLSKINGRLDKNRSDILRLRETKEYQVNFNPNPPSISNKDFQQYKNDIDNKIIEINSVISSIQRDLSKSDSSKYVQVEQLDYYPTAPPVKVQDNVFYMSSPSNNYFPLTAKSNNKENTLYKFTTKRGNKDEADFEVINDGSSITVAIDFVSNYIEPACDAENSPGNNVSRIITKKPGKASFDGEKWLINNKAEIRYE